MEKEQYTFEHWKRKVSYKDGPFHICGISFDPKVVIDYCPDCKKEFEVMRSSFESILMQYVEEEVKALKNHHTILASKSIRFDYFDLLKTKLRLLFENKQLAPFEIKDLFFPSIDDILFSEYRQCQGFFYSTNYPGISLGDLKIGLKLSPFKEMLFNCGLPDIKYIVVHGQYYYYKSLLESQEKESDYLYPAKYAALLHLVRINLELAAPLPRHPDDKLIKKEVEKIARQYNVAKQEFYRKIKDLDFKKPNRIAITMGKNYKKILIELSNNDPRIISFIKTLPKGR